MVLHHVPQGAGCFVVPGAFLDADCLRRCDLNAGDVVAVPDRFEDRVGEPQNHDVLDGFLAEVVVDPEDLILLAAGLHDAVEGLGTAVIAPERLFDDHPTALWILQQTCIGQGTAAAAIELG